MRALLHTKKGYTLHLANAPKKLKSAGGKEAIVIEDISCMLGLEE